MASKEGRPLAALEQSDAFVARHIGTSADDQATMLAALGYRDRAALMAAVVPAAIRRATPLALPGPVPETEALGRLRAIAAKNRVMKSFIGQGYYGTHTPGSSPATSSRIPRGTRPTRRTSPRSRRAGSKRWSTSRRWSAT
jgi:hypothetical protein